MGVASIFLTDNWLQPPSLPLPLMGGERLRFHAPGKSTELVLIPDMVKERDPALPYIPFQNVKCTSRRAHAAANSSPNL